MTTGGYNSKIETAQVTKETDACVWVKRRDYDIVDKCLKISTYSQYHKTFEEAKEYLLKDRTDEAIRLREKLAKVEVQIVKIDQMREPEKAEKDELTRINVKLGVFPRQPKLSKAEQQRRKEYVERFIAESAARKSP